ncbi:hypothetical protein [Sphingomonas sp. 28-62-11]|uniref:hypothetical protein n=1 Tax=Sphingomonas sp. 28-62-11 TaxID=1970432 RepID=UPI000BD23437|nr:MAG: hypothetical protein B7Y49_07080 [Sphingomonas sp. 28-62-11]
MVEEPRRQRLILPVAPLGGAAMGLVTAIGFALVPGDILGRIILRSGIPAVIAAAEPPLGMTARIALALLGGGTIALLGWFAVFLVLGSRTLMFGRETAAQSDLETGEAAPVLRRADAHPDAPSRRPVFANRDLGTPFLEVRARHPSDNEQTARQALPMSSVPMTPPIADGPIDLPVDLDMPLSAYDPAAIGQAMPFVPEPLSQHQAQPLVAPSLVSSPSRQQIFEPSERFETFELTPMVRAEPVSPPEPRREPRDPRDTQATITALLERLERGVTDRHGRPPAPAVKRDTESQDGLQDTLGTLRRMATRG